MVFESLAETVVPRLAPAIAENPPVEHPLVRTHLNLVRPFMPTRYSRPRSLAAEQGKR